MRVGKGIICLVVVFAFTFLGYKTITILEKVGSYITANGLSDRVVKSDQAIISIRIENNADSIEDIQEKRIQDKKTVIDLILKKGFDKNEVIDQGCRVSENYRTKKDVEKKEKYNLIDTIKIRSDKIDLAEEITAEISQLVQKNILISTSENYVYKNFDKLRIEMIEEASKDSFNRASLIAKSCNSELKGLRNISTGTFSIFSEGSTSNYDNSYSDGEGSIMKRIRIVVKGTYNIK